MQYIILDMEWNQPWPGSYSAKKALPSPLRGEIVQIGAVRLLENRTVADEFQILIQPKYFKKMNRKVSSLTGIGGGLRGSGLAGGGRGALSSCGRGRCAGSGAAAGDEHAGCHAGGQDRGNLLLHRFFSFFAFRPLWGIFVLCPS